VTEQEVRSAAALLAPGLLTLKLFYLFGVQRPRSQWEWTTWSVLVSFPIDWAVRAWAPRVAAQLQADPIAADLGLRIALPFAVAIVAAIVWMFVRRADADAVVWFRRAVTDSAWDEVIDNAVAHKRWVEVLTIAADADVPFRGWIDTAGREDAQAEPWVYLVGVTRKVPAEDGWPELPGTHGMLIHRDHIRRIRIFEAVQAEEPAPTDRGEA
jgi:hypothetical protein